MTAYVHSQHSPLRVRLPVFIGVVIVVVAFLSDGGFQVLGTVLIAGALIALLSLVLGRLTVEVRPDHVRVALGAGWPARTILFEDIVSVAAVRNSWWHGWGIRWIPGGRLWNMWGLDAVEVQLTSAGDSVSAQTSPTLSCWPCPPYPSAEDGSRPRACSAPSSFWPPASAGAKRSP